MATALIERGDLSADDANEVMEELGCWYHYQQDTAAEQRQARHWDEVLAQAGISIPTIPAL